MNLVLGYNGFARVLGKHNGNFELNPVLGASAGMPFESGHGHHGFGGFGNAYEAAGPLPMDTGDGLDAQNAAPAGRPPSEQPANLRAGGLDARTRRKHATDRM